MEACEVVLRLLSEMRRKGGNGARIACFQLGKRLQITLRGRIIKLFSPYWFKGTQGLRSPSEQQITNRPSMEILHRLCQRSTDTDASTKLLVGSFEPRTNISCIAIGGVIEEADTTEVPHHRRSGMDANSSDTERCSPGAPNSTCKASPTILATVPSWANTISVMPAKYSLSSGPRTLGSNVSTRAVKPVMSVKSVATSRRCPQRSTASTSLARRWARFGEKYRDSDI